MGVPKFFRFISERYPCLSELVREEKIPEFDNLYLDMNGIIHNCTHPDDANVHFRLTEEEMHRDIFMYLDKLFFLIKPRKLFFMAVDGVAPRAKMNQQRSRRFRSAKEAEVLQKAAVMKGEVLPDTERFDSNCITPGTEFMVRLQNSLKKYIQFKINYCPRWQGVRVILSGHETPGEGEHKIMEYIRYIKADPEYDPNTRHCLYGLDADLIVLGLCTHELHFSLLREEVRFGRKAKRTTLEETRFYLFHLTLLRDYLELEFQALKTFERFDIDKLIDDWILMGFLVGNDFIPHLPFLHINSDALPNLYEAYIKCWPQLDGYINENGDLNLGRLQIFMTTLASYEENAIDLAIGDIKYLDGKRSTKDADIFEAFDFADPIDMDSNNDDDLNNLIKETELFMESIKDDDLSEADVFKRNYYISKLRYTEINPEVLHEQTKCYITALQWILYYYYKGVPSWGWFYPHHYAPFASDMVNIADLEIKFDLGHPFLPFEQLLAVLPSASKELLPKAFWDLMTNPNSSLINYYPNEFETDLNGKKMDWEAVVLIPFIDEDELLKAMEPCIKQLSIEEHARNVHGPMLQYDYLKTTKNVTVPSDTFKANGFCNEKIVWREELELPQPNYSEQPIRKIVHKGFPTFKFLQYKAELRNARVKVFEQPSRKENMIIIPEMHSDVENLLTIAEKYLNKVIFIGWPHLIEAKVMGISTRDEKVNKFGQLEKNNNKEFDLYAKRIYDHNMTRMGIDFGEIKMLIHILPMSGWEQVYNLSGKVTDTKVWSNVEIQYPLQAVVFDAFDKTGNREELRVENVFPIGSSIFMLGQPYYGCEGKVLDTLLVYACGRMKVSITVLPEPDLSEARTIQSALEAQYFNQYDAAAKLGITALSVARITGTILVIKGERRPNLPENTPKVNIGLQLRYHKSNEELVGYTRKIGNTWLYSNKSIDLIKSYYDTFPRLVELISKSSPRDDIFESELCSDLEEDSLTLNNITAWLKDQEHKQAERVTCGTKTIQKEAVTAIISSLEKLKALPVRNIKLQVKPHLVLKPGQKIPESCKLKKPLRLFDRVVVVKDTYQVPFGCRGTIVALHPVADPNPVRIECMSSTEMFYEILLDKEHPDGNKLHGLAAGRIFKVSEQAIIPTYETDARINRAANKAKEANKGNNNAANTDSENVQKILCKKSEITIKEVGEKVNNLNDQNHKVFVPELSKQNIPAVSNEAQAIEVSNICNSFKVSYPHPPMIAPFLMNKPMSNVNNFIQPPFDQWFKPPNLNEIPVQHEDWRYYPRNQHNFNKQRTKIIPFKGEETICNKINTDKTEALKELLGLSGRARNDEKPSNLKNVFPQPPPNWRIESFRTSTHRAQSFGSPRSQYTQNNRPIKILEKNTVHYKPLVDMPPKLHDMASGIAVQRDNNVMDYKNKGMEVYNVNAHDGSVRDSAQKKKKTFRRKTPRIAAKFDNI